jgi:hypothetical protein
MQRDSIIVYFDGHRMGEALVLDLHANARRQMSQISENRHD